MGHTWGDAWSGDSPSATGQMRSFPYGFLETSTVPPSYMILVFPTDKRTLASMGADTGMWMVLPQRSPWALAASFRHFLFPKDCLSFWTASKACFYIPNYNFKGDWEGCEEVMRCRLWHGGVTVVQTSQESIGPLVKGEPMIEGHRTGSPGFGVSQI